MLQRLPRLAALVLVCSVVLPPGPATLGQAYYQYYQPYRPYDAPAYPYRPYRQPDELPPPDARQDVAAEMLAVHNRARRAVGVPDLHWSARVAGVARRWASHLQAEGCPMRHSGNPDYGENLAWISGRRMRATEAAELWLGEARDYDRAANACAPGRICGHYTQMVWRSTRSLGCAAARCAEAEVWVCNYDPPGNYVGHRPY